MFRRIVLAIVGVYDVSVVIEFTPEQFNSTSTSMYTS